jgi:hypothetical protein
MTSSSKIPYGKAARLTDNRQNITITLDVLGEFFRRPDPSPGDHTISGFLTWLRERQNANIHAIDLRKSDAGQYACALDALKSSGADRSMAKFIFENTGIVLTVCERLVALRVDDIEENVLFGLLQNIFILEEGGIE